jgi:uncharacterized protein YjdB
MQINESKMIATNYYIMDENLDRELTVTSSNKEIVMVSDKSMTKDGIIKFNIKALSNGSAKIIIVLKAGNKSKTKVIKIKVAEYKPTTYTVELFSEAPYGFELGSDGYYKNNCNGYETYAICRVHI